MVRECNKRGETKCRLNLQPWPSCYWPRRSQVAAAAPVEEKEAVLPFPLNQPFQIAYLYGLDCTIYNSYISQGLSHDQASERTQTLSIRMINADAAYQRGYDGAGVTLGFYEFGIYADHPELDGVLVADDKSECQPEYCGNAVNTEEQARNHATSLAAVAAGRRNGLDSAQQGMHGVAPGARVRFISFGNDEFIASATYTTPEDALAIEHLNPLVPIAFSGVGGLVILGAADLEAPSPDARIADALKQAGRLASDRTIWVFPAGNRGDAMPRGTASYAIYIPELRDHVLSAVALGEDRADLG